MRPGIWSSWLPRGPLARAVIVALLLVAVMTLATAVVGIDSATPVWDITHDPASGLLPF